MLSFKPCKYMSFSVHFCFQSATLLVPNLSRVEFTSDPSPGGLYPPVPDLQKWSSAFVFSCPELACELSVKWP